MVDSHDPIRQVNLLRQALTSASRPIAILIGAGGPVSITSPEGHPLIPDITGMTKAIASQMSTNDLFSRLTAGLRATSGMEPNVEECLSHIRSLAEVSRHSNISGLDRTTLVALDEEICGQIQTMANVSLPDAGTGYHNLAAWALGVARSTPLHLFTTNYDLLLEQALERHRVPYFDGFIGSRQAFFDPYAIEEEEATLPPRWSRLWKLHGSINWWAQNSSEREEVIRSMTKSGDCLLVHPSHLKYDESRQMPYLSMMDRLRAFLRRPGAILVSCGYSYADRHINALLRQSLVGNRDAAAFALLRSPIAKYSVARKLAGITPNMSVFARDAAVVGTRESPWRVREPSGTLPPGVTVSPATTAGVDILEAEVRLGDFAVLGRLLQHILGDPSSQPPSPQEASNV